MPVQDCTYFQSARAVNLNFLNKGTPKGETEALKAIAGPCTYSMHLYDQNTAQNIHMT